MLAPAVPYLYLLRSDCAILETTTTPQRYFNNYNLKVKISAGTLFVSGITFPSSFTAEPKTYSILLKWEEPTGGKAVAIQEYSINWVSDSGDMGENRTSGNTKELTGLQSNDKYNISINAVSIDGDNGLATTVLSTTCKQNNII